MKLRGKCISTLIHSTAFLALSFVLILFSSAVSSGGAGQVANSQGSFTIGGAVSRSLVVSLSDLASMPQIVVNTSLYCQGVLLAYGNWSGVTIGYLLDQVGADPTAENLDFHASDGYEVSLALSDGLRQQIIAYALNGEPLGATQLVLPDWEGSYWIRMITEIEVTLPGITVTPIPSQVPQPTMTPPPTATPNQTEKPVPLPSYTVKPTPSSIPTSSIETPNTTQTPNSTLTEPKQSTQITRKNTTDIQNTETSAPSSQTQNQTAPSPSSPGMSSRQDISPDISLSSSWTYSCLFAGIAVAASVALVILILRNNRKQRLSRS